MKKKISVFMAFLLIWSMTVMPAIAADNQDFINSYYQENDSELNMVCSLPDAAQDGTFTVTVAGEEVSISDVTTIGEAGTAKTVYCLVDISGTMSARMDTVKEVLHTVAAGLGTDDNMVIAQFGNELSESAFLTDSEEIESEINALAAYHEQDTNLYQCLMNAIGTLQTNQSVNDMAFMIVLSDGIDDQTSGATLTEALNTVAAADIPVFTVAPDPDATDEDEVEGAKILGSFARSSAGGVHFPKSEEGSNSYISMTGEEIGTEILSYIRTSLVVSIDLSEVAAADSYTISITYEDGTGNAYKDSVQLASTDITLPEPTTTEPEPTEEPTTTEPEPTQEPTTTAEPTTTEESDSVPAGVWIGIAAAVILLLVLILVMAARSKKKKQREEEERLKKEQEEKERKAEQLRKEREERERQEKERQKRLAEEQRKKQEAYARLPKLTVRLAVIGKRNLFYTAELPQDMEVTFGSGAGADCVLYAEDTGLMPTHFKMLWTGKTVYMWNAEAGNVTSHNGVVINALGRVAVESGDIIRAGGTEYRTYWEER
ncbi:MAG: VWA domain-containing protein [Lachnospiraceae bacterium]|nr:VWA domain-containing protein [Lachnospiraceae bacterium]